MQAGVRFHLKPRATMNCLLQKICVKIQKIVDAMIEPCGRNPLGGTTLPKKPRGGLASFRFFSEKASAQSIRFGAI